MGHEKLLKTQVYERYRDQFQDGFGRSRHKDKAEGATAGRIYSKETYRTYRRAGDAFASWMREEHPRVRKLDDCRAYVNEYLAKRLYSDGVSPHTFKTEKSALAKLFGVEAQTDAQRGWIASPRAARDGIARSRGEAVRDSHFSLERNKDLVEFCRSTGLRRHELERLKGSQLRVAGDEVRYRAPSGEESSFRVPEGKAYLEGVAGKGGRVRFVEVVGDIELVERLCREAGEGRVFPRVHNAADVHGYRADYAARVYRAYERDPDSLPREGRYWCRGDMRGVCLDREAMARASANLGHNRIDVIASNYLHTL